MSLKMPLSIEAKDEITNRLNSKEFYVNDEGKLYFSNATDTLDATYRSMTQ